MPKLVTTKEASKWASEYLNKDVTASNISYLVNYGNIQKFGENGKTLIDRDELQRYYNEHIISKEEAYKASLGKDLNWALSFSQYKESETTKHVHRLHPYKGKFIPQLVEYFLDDHIDEFKTEVYFRPGDIVLDPFSGSGTTMVQANELGIHAIGLEISKFNTLIGNIKVGQHRLTDLAIIIQDITTRLSGFISENNIEQFDSQLQNELSVYNKEYFLSPDYKYQVKNKLIIEKEYYPQKVEAFRTIFNRLVNNYNIQVAQEHNGRFLNTWFSAPVRAEIDFVHEIINNLEDENIKNILKVILSRTIRSCRATTHSDLATIKEPVLSPYYCTKHYKICKPLFSILKMWNRYSKDTIKRLQAFSQLRTNTFQHCLTGDSTSINIFDRIEAEKPEFGQFVRQQKIKGIFSSPPYVGLINYHEQHAYAYDLYAEFERQDDQEIGSMNLGSSKAAKEAYVNGISAVLENAKEYLVDNFDIFLVANDKYDLYSQIAEKVNMRIINKFKRPVLNRTERTKGAYSEIIFHLKRL